jgi:hypothetical protein
LIIAVLLVLAPSVNLDAAELGWLHGGLGRCWPSYVSRSKCCDVYCSKPLPMLPCRPECTLCDDYCPKPYPTICLGKSCCPDDYCPKPCPVPLPPICYKCVTLPDCCAEGCKHSAKSR